MGIEIRQRRTFRNRPDGYTANLGPIEGSGRTQKDARDDLMQIVERAVSGSYTPELIQYGDASALVYRDPHGWHYQFWTVTHPTSPATITVGGSPRGVAIARAKSHVAQVAYPERNGLDLLADDPASVLDHCHWIGFQRAYEDARRRNFNDNESHRFACERANNRALWLTSDENDAYNAAQLALRP